MRLQFKILFFVVIQVVVILAALAAVTLQIGKQTITEGARRDILNDFTSFARASREHLRTGEKKDLNKIIKKFSTNTNVMYFVLQDPNGRLLLFQSMASGVDTLIKRTLPKSGVQKTLNHSGFTSHSMYSMNNELVTEMLQEVRDGGELKGLVRLGIREAGMRKSITRFTRAVLVRLVYIDLWVILASFLCTFIFARWLERPIKRFQKSIHDVLSRHDESNKKSEITLDQAADRFEIAMKEMVNVQKERLEFVSTLSHEFRSPLQAIIGYAGYLRSGLAGPINAEMDSVLGVIEEGSTRFEQFMNDILDLMRIETGKISISVSLENVKPIIGEVSKLFQIQAQKQNIQIVTENAQDLPLALCDPEKIHRILLNLVSNSLKFTPSGGKIKLEVKNECDFIRFTVSDTGTGIPKEAIYQVFNKFYQVSGQHPEYGFTKGLGIGLPICRALVEAQKGKIWIKSKQGRGTTVYFTVPAVIRK